MSTKQDFRTEASGPSIGTIVWGAVVIVVGALMLANRLGWLSVDPGYAAAGILLLAGLGLVIGGIAASLRRRELAHDAVAHDAAQGTAAGDLPEGGLPTTSVRRSPYEDPTGPRDERPGTTD
ncbi:hypothetical protein GCM10027449_23070 [Sinomonas notoginsengisoli]|uniref:hypothetical protein n=1 Tax=Sinomonas notoginsengisoli TaxID=1457311 RepID=UPI001F16E651|nr:hypothetical protein [Sinomonas notoginsengisoli]